MKAQALRHEHTYVYALPDLRLCKGFSVLDVVETADLKMVQDTEIFTLASSARRSGLFGITSYINLQDRLKKICEGGRMQAVADREQKKVKNTIIHWRNIDFQTVKQRINQITKQLEEVQKKYEPSSQLNSDPQESAHSDRAPESHRH
ncbi:hypothetical protein [Coleofasciculus sp. FACHB-SPT9]|uniref:hypothetical protein n=1 Tax=Cyanophyceae TaxID=3028117 RepID=UPI0016834187|nr:hypothetical protein [Coleofasciculus sp. FACHB-SPT9]MBD1891111.1 hypothetical protein [Coleofasciculus sp. FACHB-SPT9]